MKKCPFCAEEIQDEAILCKHCHSSVPPPATAPPRRRFDPVLTNMLFWAVLVLVGWLIWRWSVQW